jgi:hypothetical protein
MSLVRSLLVCSLAVIVLTGLVACGSSKKAQPDPTQAVATVTGDIPPLPTLTDPDSIPIVAQHGQLFDYNLSVPEDWKPSTSNGLDLFNVPNPGGTDVSGQPLKSGYISVACGPPKPPPMETEYSSLALARYDAAATNSNANPNKPDIAHADEGSLQPVQIGSLAGATFTSSIKLGPLTGRVDNLYVATPQCAWHVALSIYSPGDETPYFSLFDRIIQTFQPQGAG